MNAQEHVEAAEAWLETGEELWRRFTYDKKPKDPGELRRAEVAIGLSQAHSALAAALPLEDFRVDVDQSPVPSAAEAHTGVRH
ncbi:hypothetical protein L3Q65_45930 [Amycolatopsis sp. FU40]|uniref:hypothetical protein n=1 Tax=Amycolatopsis sp. FU40 TaxID=2914159 RepID=UPI001F251102|nr:hypothetical protein [Amycolatopsis sp. FU40]UKD55114.1 hypothetical protein L3Q65_45930 [Amycolatopsis sp. FU40]